MLDYGILKTLGFKSFYGRIALSFNIISINIIISVKEYVFIYIMWVFLNFKGCQGKYFFFFFLNAQICVGNCSSSINVPCPNVQSRELLS